MRKVYLFNILVFYAASLIWLPIAAKAAEDFHILVKRERATSSNVNGRLFLNGEEICRTIELPWQENQKNISCIPAGTYSALVRYDKSDHWRLQLKDVPGNRTGVQIHIGNYTSQIEGCILVGTKLAPDGGSIAPGTSAPAYDELRRRFYGTDNPTSSPDKNIVIEIQSPIEGIWKSIDPEKRWRFVIKGTKLTWIERSAGGAELNREIDIDSMAKEFRIERANDKLVLSFLGFSEEMQREILARNPKPSYMTVAIGEEKLSIKWFGLVATKNAQGKFQELRQPGTAPAKDFSFER